MGRKLYSFVHFEAVVPSTVYFLELEQDPQNGDLKVIQQMVRMRCMAPHHACPCRACSPSAAWHCIVQAVGSDAAHLGFISQASARVPAR